MSRLKLPSSLSHLKMITSYTVIKKKLFGKSICRRALKVNTLPTISYDLCSPLLSYMLSAGRNICCLYDGKKTNAAGISISRR